MWTLSLDPFKTLLLGFPKPQLYSCIPFALERKVQLAFKLPLTIMQDLNHVVTLHINLFSPEWCFLLPHQGGEFGHRESRIWLRRFFFDNWEEFQAKHLLHTHSLAIVLPLVHLCLNVVFF